MAELVAARLSSIRSDSLTRFWIINKNNNELDRCGENWRMERARDRSRWQKKRKGKGKRVVESLSLGACFDHCCDFSAR